MAPETAPVAQNLSFSDHSGTKFVVAPSQAQPQVKQVPREPEQPPVSRSQAPQSHRHPTPLAAPPRNPAESAVPKQATGGTNIDALLEAARIQQAQQGTDSATYVQGANNLTK